MWPALLCALVLAQTNDEEASKLLAQAEEEARDGRYSDARSTYERLGERFPGTDAGRTAARRSAPSAFLGWNRIVDHGPSENRVDLVLMGDGYDLGHMKSFDKLAADIPALFERKEPFREYWSYFNVIRASLLSAENGVDGFGREYDTALGARTLGTDDGHVAVDGTRVRAMLAELPQHDHLALCFVKNGVLGAAGEGFAAIGGRDASTTIHEWGHAFAGLGDEYDTAVSQHQGPVGAWPNVSGISNPKQVPWAHWIAAKHPRVGVYEGAAQRAQGAWKATSAGCVMASAEEFCPVCTEVLVLRIYSIVDPIDDCSPPPQPPGIGEAFRVGEQPLEIRLRTLKPATHAIEVRWWVLPASQTGATGSASAASERSAIEPRNLEKLGRGARGPLAPMRAKPVETSRSDDDGEHLFSIQAKDYDPGSYRVVCRVLDTTKGRGARWPLVLKDELGLLESERTWLIEIPAR